MGMLDPAESCPHGVDLSLDCLACLEHEQDEEVNAIQFDPIRFAEIAQKLLTIPYCPWQPNEGWICAQCREYWKGERPQSGDVCLVCGGRLVEHSPQKMFLLDMGRETLYGGAAGGSKSVGIMMAASQFPPCPRVRGSPSPQDIR